MPVEFIFEGDAAELRRRLSEMADKAAEGFGERIMGDARPMREVNNRPKQAAPPHPVRIVRGRAPADGRDDVLRVLVLDMLGRRVPLLDGETGQPVDFTREFGDPRKWGGDRSADVKAAAQRAAKTCVTILKARVGQ